MMKSILRGIGWVFMAAATQSAVLHAQQAAVVITGETKQWHCVTLTLDGPFARESDNAPNPFTDYDFAATFTHQSGSPTYVVPGYFAADGDAGNTSAAEGKKWRVHFSPDKTGTWNYKLGFRQGIQVAVGGDGKALAPFDSLTGNIEISANDKSGKDLRAKGRLTYVGKNYLQFAGSKEYFLKVGADAPETLLAYVDFDNTQTRDAKKGPLKTWSPHVQDWRRGDPTWKDGKGKGLIGAINYLSSQGMNVFSFLTYAAGGDGDNVWPFVDRDDKLHYDCSKLDQWGVVFAHGQQQGMYLHFKLSESENSGAREKDNVAMDKGELGPERKLYLRELIARYGYLLALNWNLGEENTQTVQQQRDMAAYIAAKDPYHHLIVTHTGGGWGNHLKVYPHMLGDQSALTGASLQTRDVMDTHRYVAHWLRASVEAGKPWVVANDEQDQGSTGTPPDPGFEGYEQQEGPSIDQIRKYALWATLMAGGAGIEYYFGYIHPENDILCENWRSRQKTWDSARFAHQFFVQQQIPFWEMQSADGLVGNAEDENLRYCFAKEHELYLVYLPNGGTSLLDLSAASGRFSVKWFNPRGGGDLQDGSLPEISGGGSVLLGFPPSQPEEDWLIVIQASK